MRIVRQQLEPSRDDAVRMSRNEKTSMLMLSYAAAILEDLPDEIGDRIAMVENGHERIRKISADVNDLLQEIRVTIPMNQRQNLVNTVDDYEARFVPKATPRFPPPRKTRSRAHWCSTTFIRRRKPRYFITRQARSV